MAVTFLLIRHAAHVDLDRRLSGRSPGIALSDVGERQAAWLGIMLGEEAIDAIIASPLDRTRATGAAIAAALPGTVPLSSDEALIEIDMGDWTGHALDTFGDDPAWRAWNDHRASTRIPGGETMAEAQARIVTRLDELARDRDGESIVVVTHADMIRGVVAHVLGLGLDDLQRFDIDPASVTRIVWGDWGARLMSLNERVDR